MAFAKTYSNREAMRSYFDGLRADWEMAHYTVGEFVAHDDAEVFEFELGSGRITRTFPAAAGCEFIIACS